jgi:ribonuclease R
LANKKVEFIGKQKKTFIYRIHDEPNEDKLLQCKLIGKFGHKIDFKQGSISQALNKLMEDVSGKKNKFN